MPFKSATVILAPKRPFLLASLSGHPMQRYMYSTLPGKHIRCRCLRRSDKENAFIQFWVNQEFRRWPLPSISCLVHPNLVLNWRFVCLISLLLTEDEDDGSHSKSRRRNRNWRKREPNVLHVKENCFPVIYEKEDRKYYTPRRIFLCTRWSDETA